MHIKISDVAKLAGVSTATVSRVINGAANVDGILRGKVLKAMSDLEYVPNTMAQSLRQKRSKIIGITASDVEVSFFPRIIKEAEKALQPKGYAVFSASTFDQPDNELKIIRQMLARRVDALLVCSTGQNEEFLQEISNSGIPVILYDRRPKNNVFPTVFVNKKKAVYLALNHLTAAGHKRIMLISGPRSLMTNYDRYMGLQKYVFEHNLDPADVTAQFDSFSIEYGREAVQKILAMPNRPTALITGSVAITAGVMMCLKENNLVIPDDMALVSSGTFTYPEIVEPRLTYIDDSAHEIAVKLLELLYTLLDGKSLRPDMQIEIEPVLHVGSSSSR